MSRDARLYLEDIVEGCSRIASYVAGIDLPAYKADPKTRDAVLRNLKGVVEGKPQRNCQTRYAPRYPRSIGVGFGGLRDVLAHGYFNVDDDLIWEAVTNEGPLPGPRRR